MADTELEDADKSVDLFEDDASTSPEEEEESQEEGQKVATESRLMIAKIVCKDFKSYAGVKELGPFHKVSVRLTDNTRMFWDADSAELDTEGCGLLCSYSF